MKTTKLILILALLAALPVAADEPTLRYHLSGGMHLIMEQEIYVGDRSEAIASRDFSMTFDIVGAEDNEDLLVKLASISGNYTAHGMKQRLPTSHLAGSEFRLLGDGRSFKSKSQQGGGGVNLGTITDGGLRPSELLAGLLPALPDGPVSVGTTWKTHRSILSLEGWAWAGGEMQHHHEVTDIQQLNRRNIVYVRTYGETTIEAADGREGFLGEGTLAQSIDWTFDADSGALLSLSVERESNGTNQLPQGEIPVRQIARYELLTNL
jgi:hypothetical protein